MVHEHERHHVDSGSLPPKASRLKDPESTLQRRAALSGRLDAVTPHGGLWLQRVIGNAGMAARLEEERSPVHDIVSRPGEPLAHDVREGMEGRLDHDFRDVRVHSDSAADTSARSVNANAYTVGSHIVFQRSAFDPGSQQGQRTLAHELTHVVQQRNGAVDGTPTAGGISVSGPSDRFEREAATTAQRAMATTAAASSMAPAQVQRRTAGEEQEGEEPEKTAHGLAMTTSMGRARTADRNGHANMPRRAQTQSTGAARRAAIAEPAARRLQSRVGNAAVTAIAGNRAVGGVIGSAEGAGPTVAAAMPALHALVVQRDGPVTEETGIKVEPGPVRPSAMGSRFPLPASVTLLKPPGGGRGGWLTAPSFMLRLDPRGMVAALLDQVSLGGFQLTNPTLVYQADTNSISAVGTVSIPTKYPPRFDSATNIDVRVRSSGLDRFDIQARTGPFVADLTVDLTYNSASLKRALKAVMAGDLGAAATGLGDIERHARFGISGSAGVGGAAHKLPLTFLRGSGSVGPSGATVWGGAAGAVGLPKGTFHPKLDVPAAGAALGGASVKRDGGYTAGYGFGGITGTPSIQNLVTGDLAGAFDPFAYAQLTAIHETANGLKFEIKISAQKRLGSTGTSGTSVEQFRSDLDAQRRYGVVRPESDPIKRADIDPAVLSQWSNLQSDPTSSTSGMSAGVEVTGKFDLLGGR